MLIEGKSVQSTKPVLSLRDLWVSYPKTRRFREALRHPFLRSQVTAIQGVSLDIYEGEILTVVGANGAGKTTLCRTVAGLLERSHGEISFQGKAVRQSGDLRGRVGVASSEERSFLMRLSPYENLLLFGMLSGLTLSQAKCRAEENLRVLEVWDYAHLPFMYCSTGIRQRVNIARAMLSLSPLVILDEPTRSIDPVSATRLRRFVQENLAASGTAVIWCTHILSEVEEFGGRTAVLHRGRVAYLGDHEGLLRTVRCAEETRQPVSSVADAIQAVLESIA